MEVGRLLVDRTRDERVDEVDRRRARGGAAADVLERGRVFIELLLGDPTASAVR
jgi:hypothetical protein